MFLYPRYSPWRSRLTRVLPWVFILGVAAGSVIPARHWLAQWRPDLFPLSRSEDDRRVREEFNSVWADAATAEAAKSGRHAARVLRTVDGDTFEARVVVRPGFEVTTRVRLRGIDAPELKASCAREFQMAEAASAALRALLQGGDVAIYNVGPDKYAGRVVADVATARTANVSAALLAAGHVRRYDGGHRSGWC